MFFRTISIVRCLPALIALLLLACPTMGQLPLSDPLVFGSRYVVAFPGIAANSFDRRFPSPLTDKFFLYLYSTASGAKVRITSNFSGTTIDTTLIAGRFLPIELPVTAQIGENGTPLNNTYVIEAAKPIVVYCYTATRFGGEAWTPIPVESWGKEYFVAALPGRTLVNVYPAGLEGAGEGISVAPATITVVAAYDDTEVTIVPNAPLRDNPVVKSVTLRANQAYQVQSAVDTASVGPVAQPDLGGSRITATRPIAVISGNTRSQVVDTLGGITKNTYKNMLIEWLAPTEQHGREFAYLPTWDPRSPKNGSPQPGKRANEYVRIYGTSSDTTLGAFKNPAIGIIDTFRILQTGFREVSINRLDQGIYFKIDRPAQLVMHSSGVSSYNDTSEYPGEKKGISYNTWSPYMVEMTPREQWGAFAPFIAPLYPPSIDHYINVVTDSANVGRIFLRQGSSLTASEEPFIFNRGAIPGSDLVWGTLQIIPGVDYALRGVDTSARFHGFVYGVRSGYEILRFTKYPEYEESGSISYGYPLAPSRRVVAPGDELEIHTERLDCYDLWCRLRIANADPAGLRAVWLGEGAANTRISFLKPSDSAAVLYQTAAEFTVSPIDTARAAAATVIVMDRTGRYWTIPYDFIPTPATITPEQGVAFGDVRVGTGATHEVIVANPLDRNIRVEDVRLASGASSWFKVVGSSEILPASLPPGGMLKIAIRIIPTAEGAATDELRIRLDCATRSVAMQARGVRPCIEVDDLDFGTTEPNRPQSLWMDICNTGSGSTTLVDSTGRGIVTWLPRGFSILSDELARLKDVVITPGSCVKINVSFSSADTGAFTTTARIWADTRTCRDTSIWRAVVVAPPPTTGAAPETPLAGYIAPTNQPNPLSATTEIVFSLGSAAHTTVAVFDAAGRRVALLADGMMTSGEHRLQWDAGEHPAGIYYCRISSGDWSASAPMTVTR